MPRGFSNDFNARLQARVLPLAVLVKLTRRDATVIGFTSADRDLVVDSVTYQSADGLDISAHSTSIGSGIDNSEIRGFLDDDRITLDDLQNGLYNGATIEVFLTFRDDLTLVEPISRGFVGEVFDDLDSFKAEVRGLLQLAKQKIGWLTGPLCRWEFGGAQCGYSKVTDTDAVASVASNRVFDLVNGHSRADGFYVHGVVTWLTGANAGLTMEVKSWDLSDKEVGLFMEMPADIEVGDTFTISEGCDLTWATCKLKANAARFGGEPHMRGTDNLLRMPK